MHTHTHTHTHLRAHAHARSHTHTNELPHWMAVKWNGWYKHVCLTYMVHVQVVHTDAKLHAKNATICCLVVVIFLLQLEAHGQDVFDCLHCLKLGAGPEGQKGITCKLDDIPLGCNDGCKWRKVQTDISGLVTHTCWVIRRAFNNLAEVRVECGGQLVGTSRHLACIVAVLLAQCSETCGYESRSVIEDWSQQLLYVPYIYMARTHKTYYTSTVETRNLRIQLYLKYQRRAGRRRSPQPAGWDCLGSDAPPYRGHRQWFAWRRTRHLRGKENELD